MITCCVRLSLKRYNVVDIRDKCTVCNLISHQRSTPTVKQGEKKAPLDHPIDLFTHCM